MSTFSTLGRDGKEVHQSDRKLVVRQQTYGSVCHVQIKRVRGTKQHSMTRISNL